MQIFRMLALAFLAGGIGAGAVWYGWGLVENANSLMRSKNANLDSDSDEQGVDGDGAQGEGEEALT